MNIQIKKKGVSQVLIPLCCIPDLLSQMALAIIIANYNAMLEKRNSSYFPYL